VGRYFNDEIDATYEVELKDGQLALHASRVPLDTVEGRSRPEAFDIMGGMAKFTFRPR